MSEVLYRKYRPKKFGDVLKKAQEKGYAETDPTFDVEGVDAAHKLAVLISLAYGVRIRFEDFETHTKEKTLGEATADLTAIKKTAKQLLQPFLADKRKIRLVGVRLAQLEEIDRKQKLVQEYLK